MRSQLELDFNDAMVGLYKRALAEAKYDARRFIQMVGEIGGVETAKTLINAATPSDGYTELQMRKRLDLTVEALVVENPKWHELFAPTEIQRAKDRLEKYEYISK